MRKERGGDIHYGPVAEVVAVLRPSDYASLIRTDNQPKTTSSDPTAVLELPLCSVATIVNKPAGISSVIGSDAGLRIAAKIAYVGLAHMVGVKLTASQAFSEVRGYVVEGKPNRMARIFLNKRYLNACQQGPDQHSIAVAARRDTHRADAIVRLFGELCSDQKCSANPIYGTNQPESLVGPPSII